MPYCLACAHGDLRKLLKKQAETFCSVIKKNIHLKVDDEDLKTIRQIRL